MIFAFSLYREKGVDLLPASIYEIEVIAGETTTVDVILKEAVSCKAEFVYH